MHSEYVYLGNRRIAALSGTSVRLYVPDSLGSARVITDGTGVVYYDADFTPYGGERTYTDAYPTLFKFEGKIRDYETGNDDFGARYYSNRFGRWLSADWSNVPAPVPYANLTNPQTLNLYSMVADDPESFADLDGHQCRDRHEAPNGPAGGADSCPMETKDENAETQNRNAANNNAAQTTNSAFQFAKDETIGMAKEVANSVIGLTNIVDNGINALLGTNLQTAEFNPATPGEKAAMLGTSIALVFAPGGGELKLTSSIGTDAKLTKLAEEAGQSVQKGLDHLVGELSKGNTNPGLGTKSLGSGISYARARDGARVFFRQVGDTIDIVAKASKANEARVINYLKSLY